MFCTFHQIVETCFINTVGALHLLQKVHYMNAAIVLRNNMGVHFFNAQKKFILLKTTFFYLHTCMFLLFFILFLSKVHFIMTDFKFIPSLKWSVSFQIK